MPRSQNREVVSFTSALLQAARKRFSTAAAERGLIAADMRRARRAEVVDQHAAEFILQGALDRLARRPV